MPKHYLKFYSTTCEAFTWWFLKFDYLSVHEKWSIMYETESKLPITFRTNSWLFDSATIHFHLYLQK